MYLLPPLKKKHCAPPNAPWMCSSKISPLACILKFADNVAWFWKLFTKVQRHIFWPQKYQYTCITIEQGSLFLPPWYNKISMKQWCNWEGRRWHREMPPENIRVPQGAFPPPPNFSPIVKPLVWIIFWWDFDSSIHEETQVDVETLEDRTLLQSQCAGPILVPPINNQMIHILRVIENYVWFLFFSLETSGIPGFATERIKVTVSPRLVFWSTCSCHISHQYWFWWLCCVALKDASCNDPCLPVVKMCWMSYK